MTYKIQSDSSETASTLHRPMPSPAEKQREKTDEKVNSLPLTTLAGIENLNPAVLARDCDPENSKLPHIPFVSRNDSKQKPIQESHASVCKLNFYSNKDLDQLATLACSLAKTADGVGDLNQFFNMENSNCLRRLCTFLFCVCQERSSFASPLPTNIRMDLNQFIERYPILSSTIAFLETGTIDNTLESMLTKAPNLLEWMKRENGCDSRFFLSLIIFRLLGSEDNVAATSHFAHVNIKNEIFDIETYEFRIKKIKQLCDFIEQSPSFSYDFINKQMDLSELRKLTHEKIEGLEIVNEKVEVIVVDTFEEQDILILQNLKNLKGLGFKQNLRLKDPSIICSLKKLTDLESLDFSYSRNNEWISEALTPISDFKKLKYLALETVNINSLHRLENLHELKSLKIIGHKKELSGDALDQISKLIHLENLDLGSCKSCDSLAFLLPLNRLKTLNLANSPIVNADLLAKLPNLVSLNLSKCVHIKDFRFLKECRNLKDLDLSSTWVREHDFIDSLQHLENLMMGELPIEPFDFIISNAHRLKNLSLHHTKVKKVDLNCIALEELSFSGCKNLGEFSIQAPNLTLINLDSSSINNLSFLSKLSQLKTIILRSCYSFSEIPDLDLHNLEFLDLAYCENCKNFPVLNTPKLKYLKLSNLGINHTSNRINLPHLTLPSLEELILNGWDNLTNLKALSDLTTVQILNLTNCKRLENLDALHNLKKLRTLNLTECINIPNHLACFTYLESLEELILKNCLKIKDLSYIGRLNNLQKLDFSTSYDQHARIFPTSVLTDQDIQNLAPLKNLTELNLKNSEEITKGGLTSLVPELPNLKYLYMPDKLNLRFSQGSLNFYWKG